MQGGLSPKDAARKAMDEVTGPILAITSVLAAVFIPSAFLSGLQGEFYRQFALTIAISTILSAINSLTLSPALASVLLKPHQGTDKKDMLTRVLERLLGSFFGRFNTFFDRLSESRRYCKTYSSREYYSPDFVCWFSGNDFPGIQASSGWLCSGAG